MKKFINTIIVVSILLFIFVGCLQTTKKGFDVGERSVTLRDMLAQGKEVAKLSPSPEVPEALEFLSVSMFLAEPLPGTEENVLMTKAAEEMAGIVFPIRTVPLKKEDRLIGSIWQKLYDSQMIALVNPKPVPVLIVKIDCQISNFFKGLLVIHESLHVVDFVTKRFQEAEDETLQRNLSEYHVYYRCNEILRKAGGIAYAKAVEAEGERIQKIKDDDWKFSENFIQSTEKIFGKSLSEEEKGLRETHFTMDVIFSLYDKLITDKEKREMAKLDYVSNFHGQNTTF